MMTARDVGATAIKLLGVYFASRAISLYFALMLTPLILSDRAFSDADPLLATTISAAVGNLAVAVAALTGASRISAMLFPPTPWQFGGTRRDAIFVGIVLLGAWVATEAFVALVQAAGALAYYWQRQIPRASIERSLPQALANVLTLAVGLGVSASARRLSERCDRL